MTKKRLFALVVFKLENRKGFDRSLTCCSGVLETYIYGVKAVGIN